MSPEPKNVVDFPNAAKAPERRKTDDVLTVNVQTAWRRLIRTIRVARQAGLTVTTAFDETNVPRISRRLW